MRTRRFPLSGVLFLIAAVVLLVIACRSDCLILSDPLRIRLAADAEGRHFTVLFRVGNRVVLSGPHEDLLRPWIGHADELTFREVDYHPRSTQPRGPKPESQVVDHQRVSRIVDEGNAVTGR